MAINLQGMIDSLLHRRVLRRWTRAARQAPNAELSMLRAQRHDARQLRARLDTLIHVAEGRLALPRIGSSTFVRPAGTEWSLRPQIWRGPLGEPGLVGVHSKARVGEELALFHDCPLAQLTLRQIRNTREEDLAPFGLALDVLGFNGSFLSLVLDLPDDAHRGITREHVIRMSLNIETERRLEIFARLNIKTGPNTAQMVVELPKSGEEDHVAFDLAYSDLNERRVEKAWIDLIFENPAMNRIVLRDLTLSRYRRAPL